jgi:hypothetical protein
VGLLYSCYNYRFEHFKETARYISVTTMMILFLIMTQYRFLVTRLDCQDFKDASFRYERADQIILLFPAMCFAFSFECSVMPLHSVSKIRDHNGNRSYKACVYCLCIVMGYYVILMLNSFVYGLVFDPTKVHNSSPAGESCHPENLFSLSLLSILMLSNRNDAYSNSASILLLLCILVQCILQLFYTFYESRTNIHILFEELLYRDTSNYVEKTKW